MNLHQLVDMVGKYITRHTTMFMNICMHFDIQECTDREEGDVKALLSYLTMFMKQAD